MIDFENKEIFWHSSAHLMALAVKSIFPEAEFAIGPATENGFYYDFDGISVGEEDLAKIEKEMLRLAGENLEYERFTLSRKEAEEKFSGQPYKLEILKGIGDEEPLSFYSLKNFDDLCRGPHIKSTSEIRAVKLLSVAGAYWRGDSSKKMLTRIYGVSAPEPRILEEYLRNMEEAARRDHRILGKKLGIFSIHAEAPGSVFWHENGWALRNEIVGYWRKMHRKHGYREINTPIILDASLWKRSGHWDLYRENMYTTEIDERQFAVKPMSCPGSILYYREKPRSYRDFPLKIAELGLVHRHELSGTLHGLMRVRQFTQDDAHIYVTPEMLEPQIAETVQMAAGMLGTFGFRELEFNVSVRGEKKKTKYLGDDRSWKEAEDALKRALGSLELDYTVSEGEAKFYGPSADVMIRDSMGRKWQCSTIQLDFNLPERFGLEYTDSDGKKKVPVMLHRTILGSIERFIGVYIEHVAGVFPAWLAPVQCAVLPVTDGNLAYAGRLFERLEDGGFRCEIISGQESLGKRMRRAIVGKVPFFLTAGNAEESGETVSVRRYGVEGNETMSVGAFEKMMKSIVESRK